MPVNADTDLATLNIDQINELVEEAGEEVTIDTARFIQLNASDEYQYEVTYFSPGANTFITNHVFVDLDLDGDPRLQLNDFDEQDDLNPFD